MMRKNAVSIMEMHPELAEEWSERNIPLRPDQVSFGSNQKIWWKGKSCGHEWQSSPKARSGGEGCPYCSGKRVLPGVNDLASRYPELAAEWSPKNTFSPAEVTAGSSKKAYWICSEGHEWEAIIKNRTAGHGCPYCGNRMVLKGFNDLATIHPKLVEEWSEKNDPLTPDAVLPFSNKKVIWRCSQGHEWKARIADRSEGSQCPYCNNAKVQSGINDLAIMNPELIDEWSRRNFPLQPFEFSPKSRETVWWKCRECGYEWRAVIDSHVKNPKCPECRRQENRIRLAEKHRKEWLQEEFRKNLPDEILRYYFKKAGITVLYDYSELAGYPFQYYLQDQKAVIELEGGKSGSEKERKIENYKNHYCMTHDIKMIRILDPMNQGYGNCVCVRRKDETVESFQDAVKSALKIIGGCPVTNIDMKADLKMSAIFDHYRES